MTEPVRPLMADRPACRQCGSSATDCDDTERASFFQHACCDYCRTYDGHDGHGGNNCQCSTCWESARLESLL